MPSTTRSTVKTGRSVAAGDTSGLLAPSLDEVFAGFRRLDTPEAQAAFADHWIGRVAPRLNETWPVLYALLKTMRDRELYRKPTWNDDERTYASFEDYFAERVGQPFATWAELEQAHRFVHDFAPDLARATLTEVQEAHLTTHGGKRRGRDFQASIRSLNAGTSRAYLLARLRRDGKTDLAEAVDAGELSAHAAAKMAGYVHPTASVRTDDPDKVAAFLARHFDIEEIRTIADLAVHLREGRG